MNKKVLKNAACLFAIVCCIALVAYLVDLDDDLDELFNPLVCGPFYLLSFGLFWGFVLFIAIRQDSESPKTSSACKRPEEPNPYETPFQMMMRKVKGEDTQKQEHSQE